MSRSRSSSRRRGQRSRTPSPEDPDIQELEDILSPGGVLPRDRPPQEEVQESYFPPNLEEEEEEEASDRHSQPSPAGSTDMSATPTLTPEQQRLKDTVFNRATARTKDEILQDEIVVPKDKRGDKGSKEYNIHHGAATGKLSVVFDVAVFKFGPTSVQGESESDKQEKHGDIQSYYVGIKDKIDILVKRCKAYDMFAGVIEVPTKHSSTWNGTDTEPWFKWDPSSTKNIIEEWEEVPIDILIDYAKDINKWSEHDSIGSAWVQELIMNSSSIALKKQVEESYQKAAGELSQGGIVYLKIWLETMFMMTPETVTAVKQYFKDFGEHGLAREQAENVAVVADKMLVMARRLMEVNDLPSDTTKLVVQGLAKASNDEFSGIFTHMLQTLQVGELGMTATLSSNPAATFKALEDILSKAVSKYRAMCITGTWLVGIGGTHICWNCEKTDHNAHKCPEKRNQATFDANKKKWEESTGRKAGGGGYQRKSFQKNGKGAKKDRAAALGANSNGIGMIDGQWKMYCGKANGKDANGNGIKCGWNCTHTSGYHADAKKSPAAYPSKLPDNHPIWTKVQKPNAPATDPTGGVAAAAAASAAATASKSTGAVPAGTPNYASVSSLFVSQSKNTDDPDQAAFFEKLATAFQNLN